MNPSPLLDWRGQTCVIAASGPSLTKAQLDVVKAAGVRTITTNTTWQVAPWADVFYACDMLWWKLNIATFQKLGPVALRQCWTQDRASAERYGVNWVRQSARPGLGQTALQVNGNSGFGAINLAYLFGCRRILLLGFDMHLGPKGEKHWHPDHPAPCVQKLQFGEWLHKSVALARDLKESGCEVIDCTPGGALTVFKKSTIEKEFG